MTCAPLHCKNQTVGLCLFSIVFHCFQMIPVCFLDSPWEVVGNRTVLQVVLDASQLDFTWEAAANDANAKQWPDASMQNGQTRFEFWHCCSDQQDDAMTACNSFMWHICDTCDSIDSSMCSVWLSAFRFQNLCEAVLLDQPLHLQLVPECNLNGHLSETFRKLCNDTEC